MDSFFLLVLGFVLLVCGANWFVSGASSLAARLGVPSIVIGLTIVAFGTSAPELAVSVSASVQGANEIALGNVLGSNLFNLLAVIGASALIAPLVVEKTLLRRDWRACILATGLLLVCLFIGTEIARIEAALLLIFFAVIMALQIAQSKKGRDASLEPSTESVVKSPFIITCYTLGGLACVITGGQISVSASSELARQFGLSETLIGLTIVAIGTSLPEFVTSIIATKRGEVDIAIGNVIGSNLFNLLFILGISCCINPIAVTPLVIADTLLLLIATIILYFAAKHNLLNRQTGLLLLLSYTFYVAWAIYR